MTTLRLVYISELIHSDDMNGVLAMNADTLRVPGDLSTVLTLYFNNFTPATCQPRYSSVS